MRLAARCHTCGNIAVPILWSSLYALLDLMFFCAEPHDELP